MTDLFVTLEHLHTIPGFGVKPGFCNRDARALCGRYGISWNDIIRDGGVAASKLVATGDALAVAVVAHAQKVEAARG